MLLRAAHLHNDNHGVVTHTIHVILARVLLEPFFIKEDNDCLTHRQTYQADFNLDLPKCLFVYIRRFGPYLAESFVTKKNTITR